MELDLLAQLFAHNELTVDVETAAGKFEARMLHVVEELSELTRCEVEIVTTLDLDLESALESPGTITMRVGMNELRRWTFVLGEVGVRGDGRRRPPLSPRVLSDVLAPQVHEGRPQVA
jgi:hypothetical protein